MRWMALTDVQITQGALRNNRAIAIFLTDR